MGATIKMYGLCAVAAALIFAVTLLWRPVGLKTTYAAQDGKKSDAPAGNSENGKRLFEKDGCYECHGREGQGSIMSGPRIAPNPPPFEVVSTYIRKPTGEMPPYTEKVLSDKDLADIYAFLQSRPKPPAKAAEMVK